jgi:hypothetical protein
VEGSGGCGVEEAEECARLLGEDLDAVDGTESDLAEELVDGRVGGEVADVDGPGLLICISTGTRRKRKRDVHW